MTPVKIAVMGYSGAGKPTLAKALAERTGAPLQYLDRVQWLPGWVQRDRDEARTMAGAFLDRESWIIDGNYDAFHRERRIREADLILLLDFHRLVCLRQALGRYRKHRNTCRESVGEGCMEKFDLEFLLWILRDGRTAETRDFYRKLVAANRDKAVVLRSRREVGAFLRAFDSAWWKGSAPCASPH